MTASPMPGSALCAMGAALLAALLVACSPSAPPQAPLAGTAAAATAAKVVASRPAATMATFVPPAEASIPDDEFGQLVRLGQQIFLHTGKFAPDYVGNQLDCDNCHLDAGRLANASPLWAAWGMYPAYRKKNGHVNTFAERLQGCFRFSMNGKAPPLDDKVLLALASYAYWMARNAPVGVSLPGRGYPRLGQPARAPDYARGQQVYRHDCALCHGDDGQGQRVADTTVFPPLWGPQSFNWGAGMHQVDKAAAFIHANMPLGRGGMLSTQDAWDVAYFMDAHERPQDPRYRGDVATTRRQFHDTPQSLYGITVNGKLLGQGTP